MTEAEMHVERELDEATEQPTAASGVNDVVLGETQANEADQVADNRRRVRIAMSRILRAHFITLLLMWMLFITILAIAVLVSFIQLVIVFAQAKANCDQPLVIFIWVNIACAIYLNTVHVCIINELREETTDVELSRRNSKLAARYESATHAFSICLFAVGFLILLKSSTCKHRSPDLYRAASRFILFGFTLAVCWTLTSLSTLILMFLLRNNLITTSSRAPQGSMEKCQVVKFTDLPQTGEADSTCCICLESFGPGDEIRETPCRHLYHTQCLANWFCVDHTCPMCRADILTTTQQPRGSIELMELGGEAQDPTVASS